MIVTAATDELLKAAQDGDVRAGARLMTWAERGDSRFAELHRRCAQLLGRARRLGITGPPGAGKSTLVAGLVAHYRRDPARTVGVVAVDPSSPFTGGALLGDRVRMADLALDPGVFIRSMATRGLFGGLARATDDVADVHDWLGRHTLLLETVGVGQSEVDVARSADLTVVVLHPGGGDTIQAMKAGLMEAADVYVLNKADLPEADRLRAQLEDALDMRDLPAGRRPPILDTVASDGRGVVELAEVLDELWLAAQADGRLADRRRDNLARRVHRLVDGRLVRDAWQGAGLEQRLERSLAADPGLSAHALADELAQLFLGGLPGAGDGPEERR